jgi:hypothetical protein
MKFHHGLMILIFAILNGCSIMDFQPVGLIGYNDQFNDGSLSININVEKIESITNSTIPHLKRFLLRKFRAWNQHGHLDVNLTSVKNNLITNQDATVGRYNEIIEAKYKFKTKFHTYAGNITIQTDYNVDVYNAFASTNIKGSREQYGLEDLANRIILDILAQKSKHTSLEIQ